MLIYQKRRAEFYWIIRRHIRIQGFVEHGNKSLLFSQPIKPTLAITQFYNLPNFIRKLQDWQFCCCKGTTSRLTVLLLQRYNFKTDSSAVTKVQLRCVWLSSALPVMFTKCLFRSTLTFCTAVSVQNVSGFWPRTVLLADTIVSTKMMSPSENEDCWTQSLRCYCTERVCYSQCLMCIQDVYLILFC